MKKTSRIASSTIALTLVLTAIPAFAQVGANLGVHAELKTSGVATTTVKAGVAAKISVKVKDRADKEIDRRVEALGKVKARVAEMTKLSADQKASVAASLDAQIATLSTLKAKIEADTDGDVMKEDVKSITGSYRIFALIIPQTEILASADRLVATAELTGALSQKLSLRIEAAAQAGNDVTALKQTLADMTAKIADINFQAAAAATAITPLAPDNGDKAKMDANTAVLKDARAKLQAAQKDLLAAREDASVIVKGIRAFKPAAAVDANATASTTVSH